MMVFIIGIYNRLGLKEPYLFETVSFFRPIAPKIPSPQPSDTLDETRKYRASNSSGSRAFGFSSNNFDPHTISSPQIAASFASVFNLM